MVMQRNIKPAGARKPEPPPVPPRAAMEYGRVLNERVERDPRVLNERVERDLGELVLPIEPPQPWPRESDLDAAYIAGWPTAPPGRWRRLLSWMLGTAA